MLGVGKQGASVLVVVVAAVVIGCGGGGGGGGSQGAVITSGSSGGANNGALTDGSTNGNAPTSGGSTNAGTTNAGTTNAGTTNSGTTNSGTTNSGTTNAGSTDGGSTNSGTTNSGTTNSGTTNSGSTDGGTTNAGTTDGGSTNSGSTDGGTTNAGSTDGGNAGTTGSTPPTGLLRPNAIYFGHWSDTSLVSSVLPDGTGRLNEGGMGSNVAAVVPDPDNAGKFIYAALSGSSYGVYRGSTFSIASSELLASPVYDSILSLQAGADGHVAIVAFKNGVSRVFLIADGSVRDVDAADSASISLDGSKLAYTKTDGMYVWSYSSSTSSRIATGDCLYPSFSKDGGWLLFSSDRGNSSAAPWDLFQIPVAGGTIERITNTPEVSEFGGCYNATRTMVSYVGISSDPDLSGVYVASNSTATRIAADSDLNIGTYWTDANGRSLGRRGGRFQRFIKLKR